MINKVILVGRLGADPELNKSEQGLELAKFAIATNQIKDHTEWHNIIVFDKMASNVKNYLKKGSLVYVEGYLKTRTWQDKEGKERHSTDVIAGRIQFLDSKKESFVNVDEE